MAVELGRAAGPAAEQGHGADDAGDHQPSLHSESPRFHVTGACKWITIPLTAARAQRTAPTHGGQVRVDYPQSGREYEMAIAGATHGHWARPAHPQARRRTLALAPRPGATPRAIPQPHQPP